MSAIRTPRPQLRADRLYLGDNGRMFCGALRCAGATVYYTGRDISGQAVAGITPGDRAALHAMGTRARCEGCGDAGAVR